jgi:hypothetical protein
LLGSPIYGHIVFFRMLYTSLYFGKYFGPS